MEISITLKKINKSFKDKTIFSDLSYEFYKNNYHLVGKNGVGKSTLLRLLVGLDSPDSGSILLNNQFLMDSNTNQYAKKIFYVPDDLDIYPFLTGLEFLSWITKVRTNNPDEINTLIDKLELKQSQNTSIADMSFGTKKKFLLASALIGQPDFIILDEPFNGLDKHSQQVLLTILEEKAVSSGIIVTTHHDSNLALLNPLKIQILDKKLSQEEAYRV
ncbi:MULTISPECIES: ABC transporter ATP-binding protein [Legionella]|uniref:ABC transporter ATP binding protein n=1 Tax=Legionella drozanskii LLAP-1 TaxID=1212489 RepID=A0A0W0TC83_9GAMM|nr:MULTISPECIES: ABC transporter ATP-binding protein [Legionella]KTC93177.1 ABC transporter ATP binding protein [Legionella drozanskii LLAP-1]PJE14173.1 MAG: ABC transporter ATP-binding protein [Legionella sp.]